MTREQIIKQNRTCIDKLRKHQQKRLHKIDADITELNSEIAILNKEIAIIIKEQTVRMLEAERRELERNLV